MKQWWIGYVFSAVLMQAEPFSVIDLNAAKAHYNAHDALFIDAREAQKVADGTIFGSLNVPLKRFKRMKKWLPIRKDAPMVIFCNGIECGKSVALAKRLARAGYTRLMVYRAGFPQWRRHKLPILAAPRPCRCDEAPYFPKTDPVDVAGVRFYLTEDPTRVDARWFVPLIDAGRLPASVHLVDVRPHDQYLRGHLPGAINVPYDPKKRTLDTTQLPAEGVIVFYCNHGAISADAFATMPATVAARVKVLDADLECRKERCRMRVR
jgi:rhodanese-related sulfurtransferase